MTTTQPRVTYYVDVHYAAGRAGVGWGANQSRTVHIPHVTREAAEATAACARAR